MRTRGVGWHSRTKALTVKPLAVGMLDLGIWHVTSHVGEEPGLAYKVARHWIDIIGLTSKPNFRTLALEPVSLKGTGLCFKLELPAVSSGRPGWLFLYPPSLLSVRSDFPLCTRGLCVCAFRSGNWSWLLLVTSECPDLPDLNLNVILLLNLC